jgi:hypothetical protein
VRRAQHHQCVAVGWRFRCDRRADIPARATAVVDDDLLSERLGQTPRDRTRDGIVA